MDLSIPHPNNSPKYWVRRLGDEIEAMAAEQSKKEFP